MTTPADLLKEAKLLDRDPAKTETRRRTIVGRAYYAAYHGALAHETVQGFAFEPGKRNSEGRHLGRHQQLIDFLKRSRNPVLQQVGEKLELLRLRRTQADYRLSIPLKRNEESDSVALAEEILLEDLA
ncbi:MAG TPA: hypothetical protein VD978_25605 [Azospirillum sp.]|nr:hypothetical protein [Azospirillum sp.]